MEAVLGEHATGRVVLRQRVRADRRDVHSLQREGDQRARRLRREPAPLVAWRNTVCDLHDAVVVRWTLECGAPDDALVVAMHYGETMSPRVRARRRSKRLDPRRR